MRKKIEIDQWQFDRTAANARKAIALQSGGHINAMTDDGEELKSPAFQGFACRYRQLYETGAGLTVLTRGAFKNAVARNVGVLLNHDDETNFGSDGLELLDADDGLAFRYRVPNGIRGYALMRQVELYQKADVSVSYQERDVVVRSVEGHNVRFIRSAHLVELSFVKHGACPYSSARLIDTSKERTLRDSVDSGLLRFDGGAQEYLRTLAALTESANRLHQAVQALRG